MGLQNGLGVTSGKGEGGIRVAVRLRAFLNEVKVGVS